jgi:hypothetical protein
VLSRFHAQGFSARDLSRVTAIRADVNKPAVLALARLSLFGRSAARLHDQILSVGALWDEARRGSKLRALSDAQAAELRAALDTSLSDGAPHDLPKAIAQTLLDGASEDFAALWPALQDEADAEQDRATKMLTARARAEADAMRVLLANQESAIRDARREIPLDLDARERAAYEADTRAMQERLKEIVTEHEAEPARIEELYAVALRRASPVGLVYLWPAQGKGKRS